MDSPFFFERTTYWSAGDERAHFDWLDRIACISAARGRGDRVFLTISEDAVSETDLRELEAVYRRYGGDRAQLRNIKPLPDEFENADD